MFKFFIHLIVFLLLNTKSFCIEMSQFEINNTRTYSLLEHFFRKSIDREQYGYILEGAKPASCRLYRSPALFPSSKSYKFAEEQFTESLLHEEIVSTLEKVNQYGSQFIFKSTQVKQDNHILHEFLFINKSKLYSTLKENLNLFRLILSPTFETNELLNQITSSNHLLTEILKSHDALLGIVLGYLPENSLLGGREYSLHAQAISQEHPPYERQSRLLTPKTPFSNECLSELYGLYYLAYAGGHFDLPRTQRLKPSHPFKSIKDEMEHLQTKKEELPASLRENPSFIFGPYQTESSSNRFFLKLLKHVQNRTRELCKKENLPEVILEKILGSPPKITCERPKSLPPLKSLIQIDEQKWVSILTEAINCFERKQDKLAFLESFHSPCDHHKMPPEILTASPAMQRGFEIARANLEKSTAYFENAPESFKEIVPNQLYYKVIRNGEGNQAEESDEIRVRYTLEDLEGNILSAKYNTWYKLSELFQGFRHGAKGMHEKEIRKLIIHPALGYGPYTTLPSCATLILTIELHEIAKGYGSYESAPEPINFNMIKDTSMYEKIKSSVNQLPFYRGAFYAEMFDKFGKEGKKEVVTKLKKELNAAESSPTLFES